MKLADKIILLRKQKGWSQEELAAQMDVSRQSVSKWESGASTPDIDKIILLSQIFDTTTDYLLKEEMNDISDSVLSEEKRKHSTYDSDSKKEVYESEKYAHVEKKKIHVSRTEAEEYLHVMKEASVKIAVGVFLCICSVAPMMFLVGAQHTGKFGVTEDTAGILGLCILLVVVAVAVTIFITNGIRMNKFEFIEKEMITMDSDLFSEIKRKSEEYAPVFARNMAIGVVLCIVAVIPLLLASIENSTNNADGDVLVIMMTGVLLVVIAFGVYQFVKTGIIKDSYDKLLGQGDYTEEKKMDNKSNDTFSGVYWLVITAIYLAYSFLTMDWGRSWIIWPVAGVLFAAITTIINAVRKNKLEK
ncbi:MAG: helix-turn-helix domain-containing protein [Eubacterium sp.]|nr:helix-turn-helix domain-containing protein [Eubacterium sp.]